MASIIRSRRHVQRSATTQHTHLWRPMLEMLEHRRLPATFLVDSLADSDGSGTCAGSDDDCTLRDAIAKLSFTPGADTIVFDGDVVGTIYLDSGAELAITEPVSIEGPGATLLSIDGLGITRVFMVTSDMVAISGLTITNGISPRGGGIYNEGELTLSDSIVDSNVAIPGLCEGGGPFFIPCDAEKYSGAFGGGIYNIGTLTVLQSTIQNNRVTGMDVLDKPLVQFGGGGIYTAGDAVLENSLIRYNSVCDNSTEIVCIWAFAMGDRVELLGGGIRNPGQLWLADSTVADNRVGEITMSLETSVDLKAEGGGIFSDSPVLHMSTFSTVALNATLIDNRVIVLGEAVPGTFVDANGGGISAPTTNGDFCNSTISGNSVRNDVDVPLRILSGGGVWVKWAGVTGFELTSTQCGEAVIPTEFGIRWTTIANNRVETDLSLAPRPASGGGGIYIALEAATKVQLYNSIVANNEVPIDFYDPGPDIKNQIESLGYNLITDTSSGCEFVCDYEPTDLVDIPFTLRPLAYYGGPAVGHLEVGEMLRTHKLTPSSPAYNAGDPTPSSPPDFDARGTAYDRIAFEVTDIGAYECQSLMCSRDRVTPTTSPVGPPSPFTFPPSPMPDSEGGERTGDSASVADSQLTMQRTPPDDVWADMPQRRPKRVVKSILMWPASGSLELNTESFSLSDDRR